MNSITANAAPSVQELARRARIASKKLSRLPVEVRNSALGKVADVLERRKDEILDANKRDCERAAELVHSGSISQAAMKRLCLSTQTIAEMAQRLREVAHLPDPLGRDLGTTELDEGLILYKVSCPLGVVAVVFESRPDVIPQVASLALKSGNAILMKGGTEAASTNQALVRRWKEALSEFPQIPLESIEMLHSRSDVSDLLQLNREVDLLIPRGGREFVEFIARNSSIPVLGHGEGICHIYVDRAADFQKALEIVLDAKVQYPAACNSVETLLVHQRISTAFLPQVVAKLLENGVEIRGCPRTVAAVPDSRIAPAADADWSTEYSDLVLSVKVVDSLEDALDHIQSHGSGHTEAIVTEDREAAGRFLEEVDAAGVYHNASTRFGDGYRYGLGSEIGISTSKLHARGPMGLEGLTTYKYKLVGDGHTVAGYSKGDRKFLHRSISKGKTS